MVYAETLFVFPSTNIPDRGWRHGNENAPPARSPLRLTRIKTCSARSEDKIQYFGPTTGTYITFRPRHLAAGKRRITNPVAGVRLIAVTPCFSHRWIECATPRPRVKFM